MVFSESPFRFPQSDQKEFIFKKIYITGMKKFIPPVTMLTGWISRIKILGKGICFRIKLRKMLFLSPIIRFRLNYLKSIVFIPRVQA